MSVAKPDAHSFMEKIKNDINVAVRFQDAPAATVQRVTQHVNSYYMQLSEWGEQQAKREEAMNKLSEQGQEWELLKNKALEEAKDDATPSE